MVSNLRLRHKVIQSVRQYLDQQGFLDVETPTLTGSTPEGARDFLVPSRHYPTDTSSQSPIFPPNSLALSNAGPCSAL